MEAREKKKELIASNKASKFMTTGISTAAYVKEILNRLPPEEKQNILKELSL